MTEIRCEFCGPTRIAPHDVNCPDTDVVRKGDVIGWFGGPTRGSVSQDFGPTHQQVVGWYGRALTPIPVYGPPITAETNPEMFSPIMEKATDHYTVTGRRGAECFCGYNPHIDHPEAGRGQLFAYVGQHIKNESGI